MELLGWILALAAGLFVAGLLIGVSAMSKRPIINNVTQTVEHHTNVAGCGSAVGSLIGGLFPLLALGAVAVVVVSAVSATSSANQRIADTAQRSLDAQRQIVQAMPQPQIVVPPQPTVTQPPVDLMPLVNTLATVAVIALAVIVIGDIARRLISQRRADAQRVRDQQRALYAKPIAAVRQPPAPTTGITHPAFDLARQNVEVKR